MLQGLVEGIIEPYHKVFVEHQQEDSHSEGGLAVSVILAPYETQEYPNNTTEVQMEERSLLDLAAVTPAMQPSIASIDTVVVHEVPDAFKKPNLVKTSSRGRKLKSDTLKVMFKIRFE